MAVFILVKKKDCLVLFVTLVSCKLSKYASDKEADMGSMIHKVGLVFLG